MDTCLYCKKHECDNCKRKEYYLKNKDKVKEYQKEYNIKNKDKAKEYKKEYQKEYYIKNKDKRKAGIKC